MKGLSLLIVMLLIVGAELLAARLKRSGALPAQNHEKSPPAITHAQAPSTYHI